MPISNSGEGQDEVQECEKESLTRRLLYVERSLLGGGGMDEIDCVKLGIKDCLVGRTTFSSLQWTLRILGHRLHNRLHLYLSSRGVDRHVTLTRRRWSPPLDSKASQSVRLRSSGRLGSVCTRRSW